MASVVGLDGIVDMVSGSTKQTCMTIEGSEGSLVHQELSGFDPGLFSFHGFIDDFWMQLKVVLVDEGIELLLD